MDSWLMVSNVVLWVLVIGLGLTVLALARQIGVLYERVAPAGALMISQGPGVGEPAPAFQLQSLNGDDVVIGGESPTNKSTLLFFLSPDCPVCNTLIPVLKSIRKNESAWLDIVLASDGPVNEQRAFVDRKDLGEFPYVLSAQLGMTFQVAKLPFAVLLDDKGVLRAKGLTNNREHLESLFEAMERGVASIQEFMHKRHDAA